MFEEAINRDEKSGQEWKLVDKEIQSEFLYFTNAPYFKIFSY
jgi:hypothetical protein